MNVFEAVLPVVLVATLGYGARRLHIFSEIETSAIERIAFWYLLPCMLFLGGATAHFPADIDWHYLGVFYGVLFATYLGAMLIGRVFFRLDWHALSVFGMAGSYSNVTVLGIPLTLQFLGAGAFVPMILIITFHNLLLFGFGTLLMGLAAQGGDSAWGNLQRVVKEMVVNPISGSLLLGAAWNLTGAGLYAPVEQTLELIGRAAVPGALFALGAGLTRYRISGELSAASLIVVLKLCAMPLMMWWAMQQFDFDPLWRDAAVLLSAMPVGISVYVFSRRYAALETAAATGIVLSSLLAAGSISMWAWWLLR
jgi:malonate transporter